MGHHVGPPHQAQALPFPEPGALPQGSPLLPPPPSHLNLAGSGAQVPHSPLICGLSVPRSHPLEPTWACVLRGRCFLSVSEGDLQGA